MDRFHTRAAMRHEMPEHLQTKTLFRSAAVRIEDVRCRPVTRSCGREEVAARPAFAIVRSGVFVRHAGSHEGVVNPNHVVFFSPDRPYAISHPVTGGDDCTSFTFPEETLRDVLREVLPYRADEAPDRLLPGDETLNDSATALALYRLRAMGHAGALEVVGTEEVALDMLARLITSTSTDGVRPDSPRRAGTKSDHRALASRTRLFLSTSFRERLDLASIARAVDSSPFHLSRVFRRETGWPIHRYLLRLRLRASLAAIADGCDDLAGLAVELGFASHSHLTDSFRAEYGIPPLVARARLARP